ncbi:MAG: Gfo/Idh/MocA family oxidoreductase [Phycisphaerae bacterium]|jgi:predicted dehydrogenase
MSRLSRRGFLKGSLAVAGGATLARPVRSFGVLGANDRIRVAVAGLNGRGGSHVGAFLGMKDQGVEIAYIVDPDSRLFAGKLKQITDRQGSAPLAVQDIRKALDDKELNVISVATPNHWHALITIWGCQAGKDVYVEKPMSHNIHEGRIAVECARRYKRIVQHGTQSRSDRKFAKIAAVIASGKLGKLLVSRGLCYKPGGGESTRGDIGFRPIKPPPKELDFNIWLGPAPEQGYHENIVHYRWHWFWDFGNGDIGNQGVHQMDIARWAIPGATLPRSVFSYGGRFGPKDQGQAANSQVAIFDYGDTQLVFEVRGLKSKPFMGEDTGNLFHLEGGVIRGDGFFYPNGGDRKEPLPDVEVARGPGGEHFKNFMAAVRSRNPQDLNAEVLEGHYSSALCHLANASYRVGEEVPFSKQTSAIGDNKEAADAMARMQDYLKDNRFKLEEMTYRLGRKLTVDPKTELTDDAEANKILFGTYRAPFSVPEKIV